MLRVGFFNVRNLESVRVYVGMQDITTHVLRIIIGCYHTRLINS